MSHQDKDDLRTPLSELRELASPDRQGFAQHHRQAPDRYPGPARHRNHRTTDVQMKSAQVPSGTIA